MVSQLSNSLTSLFEPRIFRTNYILYNDVKRSRVSFGQNNAMYVHYRKTSWNIGKTPWKHPNLTFWFAGNGLTLTTNKYCDFNTTLTCSVMDEVMQFAMSDIKDKQQNVQECVIFNTSLKIFNNFQGIRHCIVNVWEFGMCSIIRFWHQAKFVKVAW